MLKEVFPLRPPLALLRSPMKYPGDEKEERGVIQREHQKAFPSLSARRAPGLELLPAKHRGCSEQGSPGQLLARTLPPPCLRDPHPWVV